jgi:hypothetical protein
VTHDCIEKMNALLAPYNTQLLPVFQFSEDMPQRIVIATDKLDAKKRGKPMLLYAKYCPMCGQNLEPQK